MTQSFKPIDLKKIKTYSLSDRKSKVNLSDFGKEWRAGGSFKTFLANIPNILAGSDIREVINSIVIAFKKKKTILIGMGAHVIKVGLNPLIIDLIKRGIISGVAMNGAGIIHDLEIAMSGKTSEDVADALSDGTFGMSYETGAFLNAAINRAGKESLGLGEAIGITILENKLSFSEKSILAACASVSIPATVHVAIGTDIIHMHPSFNPEYAGKASHRDFRMFASIVSSLEEGVYLNIGSAVILPEVFLKAITLVRNLGYNPQNFTTINMDFIRHYRPMTNVVNRPTLKGGKGFNLVGHHEIMLPIIAAGIIEGLEEN
ncbi:MAG: deoxyhypusine synthase family protein [Desulfobacterales bacterium]|nr:deoxyhypusine synthase family protein [Desulfobacterales bacterium]MBF0397190.1 deoxyhypusine synthase family protein [Desulfobacterales bacterium]